MGELCLFTVAVLLSEDEIPIFQVETTTSLFKLL